MYAKVIKRILDFCLSFIGILLLSWLFVILTAVGAAAMRGNPFFMQKRPGKIDKKTGKEKIIRLIKFRTMDNRRDKDGNLLPDEVRMNGYGRFLRSTSLDELPQLINILIGSCSIVGPRPLLISYLPYFTEEERRRHNVRPGLTGLAQVNGRNFLGWDKRLAMDVEYVDNLSFALDVKIILETFVKVIKRSDVSEKRITPLNIERQAERSE